jgi:hypothetical protein
MKTISRTIAALSMMMLLTFTQVNAQQPSTDVTRTQYTDNSGSDMNNGMGMGRNWGWVGLIGLLGLVGLMKRQRDVQSNPR